MRPSPPGPKRVSFDRIAGEPHPALAILGCAQAEIHAAGSENLARPAKRSSPDSATEPEDRRREIRRKALAEEGQKVRDLLAALPEANAEQLDEAPG